MTRAITLPAEPATLRDLKFETAVITAEAKPPATVASGAFIVQIGAFRDPVNARQLASRLARLGQSTFTDRSEGLLLVRTGPYLSRTIATAAAERLRRAGIQTYVLSR